MFMCSICHRKYADTHFGQFREQHAYCMYLANCMHVHRKLVYPLRGGTSRVSFTPRVKAVQPAQESRRYK